MATPLFHVDAFSAVPFGGNPAAVCLLDGEREAAWMQAVAAEMKHSETAFVRPGAEAFGLRWFTPAREVELCGHATLATAHVLWETGRLAPGAAARFDTRSGRLTARRLEAEGGGIEMDFPARAARPCETPEGLAAALGRTPRRVAAGGDDLLVELGSESEVAALAPDVRALGRLPVRGIIATAPADEGGDCDFVSRFFAPAVGVDEDPVTGSAHCCLAPWWAERLGRAELVGRQLSARRGRVRVRVAGNRVMLGGEAVTVLRGELLA